MRKRCITCKQVKSRSEYYTHLKMADGLLGRCKECHRTSARENRSAHADFYRQYDRNRANDPERLESRKKYAESIHGAVASALGKSLFTERFPEKKAATAAVSNAIRSGALQKEPCEFCGSKDKVEAHHQNYSKPLDVHWLCGTHHRMLHVLARELARIA